MAEKTTSPVRQSDSALRRWDPSEIFSSFQDQMDRLWREPFWGGAMPTVFRRTVPAQTAWTPRMDVYDQDNAIVVKAELPGLKKEDVHVELADGSLVIWGESTTETEVNGDAYYRNERSFGSFYRRLPLPVDLNPDQIQATMSDGVLEVRIPRPAESKPEVKEIPVK